MANFPTPIARINAITGYRSVITNTRQPYIVTQQNAISANINTINNTRIPYVQGRIAWIQQQRYKYE